MEQRSCGKFTLPAMFPIECASVRSSGHDAAPLRVHHGMWAMGKTSTTLEVRTVLCLMRTVDRRLTLLRCRCCMYYGLNGQDGPPSLLTITTLVTSTCIFGFVDGAFRTRLTRPRYPDPEADQLVPLAYHRAFLFPCNSAAPVQRRCPRSSTSRTLPVGA